MSLTRHTDVHFLK